MMMMMMKMTTAAPPLSQSCTISPPPPPPPPPSLLLVSLPLSGRLWRNWGITRSNKLRRLTFRPTPVVVAQFDLMRAATTVWRVGKDAVDSGIKLVPDSVPRPVARIGVLGIALFATIFALNAFLSTVFFVLGMMGFIYFIYIAINRGDGPNGGGSGKSSKSGEPTTDDQAMEEARRIMEKYK